MSGQLERGFQVLECLATHPGGITISALSSELEIPLSATHRLLAELVRLGYVRQNMAGTEYALTVKLAAIGLAYLSSAGLVDVAQPLLDELAAKAGDLVRLAVVDGEELIFVAKAQGAKSGLRYDPDMGISVTLSCSAAGHAWLSTMPSDRALGLIARSGLGSTENHGPNAPQSIQAVLAHVDAAKKRGFSTIEDQYAPGMSAMAAPVLNAQGECIGVITIAGPMVRLTGKRMLELGPDIIKTAATLSATSSASNFFKV